MSGSPHSLQEEPNTMARLPSTSHGHINYQPLLFDTIRLLRLFPSQDEKTPIRCQLFHHSLLGSSRRAHPYDALSYVWGNPDSTKSIHVTRNDSTSEYDLLVTDNLHGALTRLRYETIERILWIDAVSIDQNNDKEKEHQIQIMSRIYGHATRVFVWLGEREIDSDFAMEQIRLAGSQPLGQFAVDERSRSAVKQLLERPWFRRIWVRPIP